MLSLREKILKRFSEDLKQDRNRFRTGKFQFSKKHWLSGIKMQEQENIQLMVR